MDEVQKFLNLLHDDDRVIKVEVGQDELYYFIDIFTVKTKNFWPLRVAIGKTTRRIYLDIGGRKIAFTREELLEALKVIRDWAVL